MRTHVSGRAPAPAPPQAVRAQPDALRQLHATAGNAAVAALIGGRHALPLQRLIVNVGQDPLAVELRKPRGWIFAKAIEMALRDGGFTQRVVELDQPVTAPVGVTENIYLVGHGSAGRVGVQKARRVATALNAYLPEGYSGQIKSLSCSTGIGKDSSRTNSGVAKLAARLSARGVRVHGAYGIALHHPAYEGGLRTALKANWPTISKVIEEERKPLDAAWPAYVKNLSDAELLDEFMTVPLMATELSRRFYEDLERAVAPLLVAKGADATIATIEGSSSEPRIVATTTSYRT